MPPLLPAKTFVQSLWKGLEWGAPFPTSCAINGIKSHERYQHFIKRWIDEFSTMSTQTGLSSSPMLTNTQSQHVRISPCKKSPTSLWRNPNYCPRQ
ncbi:unnamed protein product [Cylicostephanus goldi]|uniref:Uncharacterized protein n=1 Tax=Cylicostephanus goldi TaxID=71465 RepID=A0A3P6SGQ0_CYLGO|nr:unnamed protein product [Cylicostephanus goldi]